MTKSPRLSLRFAFGRVKGHTWNYCAEGGRAWERGYSLPVFCALSLASEFPHNIFSSNIHKNVYVRVDDVVCSQVESTLIIIIGPSVWQLLSHVENSVVVHQMHSNSALIGKYNPIILDYSFFTSAPIIPKEIHE